MRHQQLDAPCFDLAPVAEHRERAVVIADRFFGHVAARGMLRRAHRLANRPLVARTVGDGGTAVIGERREVRVAVAAPAGLELPGDPAMQLAPFGRRDCPVEGLAHQFVRKAEAVAVQMRDHVRSDGLLEAGCDLGAVPRPHHGGEQFHVELAADDGGEAQALPRLRRQ